MPVATAQRPEAKIVAKIHLARMTPSGDVVPAFPDPLLLSYKSSINWTRYFRFQMMAETEPVDNPAVGVRDFPDDVFVPSDQASNTSAVSSMY